MVHLFHGQDNRQKRDELMSNLIKYKKFRVLEESDIEPDIFCDYNFIFGDLNYRLNFTFNELINDIQIASSFIDEKD
jgi:hypothetical protein